MKYYIFADKELQEVEPGVYENWMVYDMPDLLLPDVEITDKDKKILLSNGYLGSFEDHEEVLPFILMYFEDQNGKIVTEFTEYFDSIENLSERRKELITEIESKN